jgi:hypothetical protein
MGHVSMLYSFSMTEDIFLIVDTVMDSSIPPSLNPTPEVWAGAGSVPAPDQLQLEMGGRRQRLDRG